MTDEEMQREYRALAHAMQSGIAALLNYDRDMASPKNLRVGVNMAMVEIGALVDLLAKKGVFTEQEIGEAIIENQKKEIDNYRKAYAEHLGVDVDKIRFG